MDWGFAGRGPPAYDVAACRGDLVVWFGSTTADRFLAHYWARGPAAPQASTLFADPPPAGKNSLPADVVLGSATDEPAYLGESWQEAARRIARERTVVARLGAAGAVAFAGDKVVEAPSFAVPVVSTPGAGRARCRVRGGARRRLGLTEALRMGNAVAALKVTRREISRAAVGALLTAR